MTMLYGGRTICYIYNTRSVKQKLQPGEPYPVTYHSLERIMLKEEEEEIDITNITCNNNSPTLIISTIKARRETSRQLLQTRVTDEIIPPTNPGAYRGTTHNALEIHRAMQLAWKRYKLAQAATKKMIMHAFKDSHFLELQDDNGDIVGYIAIELFKHLMDQYAQPEDVADQVTALHKLLEQDFDPNE
ncbi:hypothetical protein FRACYDRAFT_232325 [Fragilariopsis cylindrus CCMP1102]|uniref:Uncharacterized protein n=1 Tax=Fragilariopsis cylindrus CCMP1102 TaxID=635003 RepID=A0A1E7FVJ4_9STRA|nr:hypothetical protein FRACYDRAFT_232325 [Fragilariopsis cylindrus CCMP1102]|eukprot:OEU22172.1 hypothetical protein FRACYDRAFT_232325 [Fragilariopsis cylindrus CCMP1102]